MAKKRKTKKSVKSDFTDIGIDAMKIIETFDKLYYTKPAGYFAFIATCMSKVRIDPDVFAVPKSKKKKSNN